MKCMVHRRGVLGRTWRRTTFGDRLRIKQNRCTHNAAQWLHQMIFSCKTTDTKPVFEMRKVWKQSRNCVNSICFSYWRRSYFSFFLFILKLLIGWMWFHMKRNLNGLLFFAFELWLRLWLQCWTFLQRQAKMNANQKMAFGPVFVWMFMIAIKKAAPPKDSAHLALVLVVFVSVSLSKYRKCDIDYIYVYTDLIDCGLLSFIHSFSYCNVWPRNQEQYHIFHIAQLSGSDVKQHEKLQTQD